MKIVITESQKHLLWLMRRIEDDEYLDYIWRLIKEGFDFDDPCEHESSDEYLEAILYGTVTTFINSYEELYNVYPAEVFDEMYDFIHDFMKEKYGDKIKSHYISYREICDELNEQINENFNPYSLIPTVLKRRISASDLKEMGEKLLEIAELETYAVQKNIYETRLMDIIYYIIHDYVVKNNDNDIRNIPLETLNMYEKLYDYLRYVYEDDIKEIWADKLK
jgi:hypothetical protein